MKSNKSINIKTSSILAIILGITAGSLVSAQGAMPDRTRLNDSENRRANIVGKGKEMRTATSTAGLSGIENRIAATIKLQQRIAGMSRLPAETREKLATQMQSVLSELNNLKNRNASSTNASSTATQKEKYRAYGLIASKTFILNAAARLENLASKMEALATKLQIKIAEAPATEQAELSASLKKVTDKISAAKLAAVSVRSKVAALAADSGNAKIAKSNRDTLVAAQKELKAAIKGLHDARLEANNIANKLRGLGISTSVGFGNASSTKPVVKNASSTAE